MEDFCPCFFSLSVSLRNGDKKRQEKFPPLNITSRIWWEKMFNPNIFYSFRYYESLIKNLVCCPFSFFSPSSFLDVDYRVKRTIILSYRRYHFVIIPISIYIIYILVGVYLWGVLLSLFILPGRHYFVYTVE